MDNVDDVETMEKYSRNSIFTRITDRSYCPCKSLRINMNRMIEEAAVWYVCTIGKIHAAYEPIFRANVNFIHFQCDTYKEMGASTFVRRVSRRLTYTRTCTSHVFVSIGGGVSHWPLM